MLSIYDDERSVVSAIRAGARAYVLKKNGRDTVPVVNHQWRYHWSARNPASNKNPCMSNSSPWWASAQKGVGLCLILFLMNQAHFGFFVLPTEPKAHTDFWEALLLARKGFLPHKNVQLITLNLLPISAWIAGLWLLIAGFREHGNARGALDRKGLVALRGGRRKNKRPNN